MCVCVRIKDVDECTEQTDVCPQICHNNNGSYTCACLTGYEDVNSDGKECTGRL